MYCHYPCDSRHYHIFHLPIISINVKATITVNNCKVELESVFKDELQEMIEKITKQDPINNRIKVRSELDRINQQRAKHGLFLLEAYHMEALIKSDFDPSLINFFTELNCLPVEQIKEEALNKYFLSGPYDRLSFVEFSKVIDNHNVTCAEVFNRITKAGYMIVRRNGS